MGVTFAQIASVADAFEMLTGCLVGYIFVKSCEMLRAKKKCVEQERHKALLCKAL